MEFAPRIPDFYVNSRRKTSALLTSVQKLICGERVDKTLDNVLAIKLKRKQGQRNPAAGRFLFFVC